MAAYGAVPAAEKVAGSKSDEWRTAAAMVQEGDEQEGVDEERSSAKAVQAVEVALRLRHLDLLEEFLDGTVEVLQDDDTPMSEDEGTELEGEGLTLNSTARFASAHGNRLLAKVLQAQKSPSSS